MRDMPNEVEKIPTHVLRGDLRSSRQSAMPDNDRIAELEFENARLQRLVAELVLKNQKLRDCD